MRPLRLRDGLRTGGAPQIWVRAFKIVLPIIALLVPAGSSVLEIGYGDGLLSCFLAMELGWSITGFDVDAEAVRKAKINATRYNLGDKVSFSKCEDKITHGSNDRYDAVFIKTVLYGAGSLEEYGQWLDWIKSALKPGGIFINFETGWTSRMMQIYRRIRCRPYVQSCLFDGAIAQLYHDRFEILHESYYGGWSQFFTIIPPLFPLAWRTEEWITPRTADNSFIAAIVAHKPHQQQ